MESGVIKTLFTDVEKDEALFPRTKTRAVSGDNGVGLDALLNQINTELDSKAPADFGLGDVSTSVPDKDINKCLTNGWYWTGQGTANLPGELAYSSVFVKTRLNGQVVQEITPILTYKGCKLIRITSDGGATWSEEWENPPMTSNKEYRTTERYEGKPVYVKHIGFSVSMPANTGVVDTEIPHGISDFECHVRAFGRILASDGTALNLPCIESDTVSTSIYRVTKSNIVLRTINTYWNRGLKFELYYTKTTD